MLLTDLKVGQSGKIISVSPDISLKKRLNDMGFSEGTEIKSCFKSPMGDPTAYLIKNTVIAIRKEDAAHITIMR